MKIVNAPAPHPNGQDASGRDADDQPRVHSVREGQAAQSAPRGNISQKPNNTRSRKSKSLDSTGPSQAEIDQSLMHRVATGQAGAVDELYDRFGSLVFRMAVQVLPNRAEAEDATQEVFVRLWKTAERYDSDRAALVTWVMLLTRRHLVDKLRRGKSRISAVSMDAAASLDPGTSDNNALTLEERERFGKLMERISTLPELQRMVVVRAYLGGQTLRQIGEELDIPLGTIKSALSRALVRLRERAAEERA